MEESSNITRSPRTQVLDPDLVSYPRSLGWTFDIPACFRRALDIQLTTVVENKVPTDVWTQGQNYDFQTGDTLYDSPSARLGDWLESLHSVKTALQVTSARKAEPANYFAGEVCFTVMHPDNARTALTASASYKGTQNEFIELLRTGLWRGTPHTEL